MNSGLRLAKAYGLESELLDPLHTIYSDHAFGAGFAKASYQSFTYLCCAEYKSVLGHCQVRQTSARITEKKH